MQDFRTPGSFTETMQADPEYWALRINATYRKSIEAVIEAGRLLIDAKSRLKHGQWETLISTQLDFSADTAQRLMAIARDDRLSNTANLRFLPRQSSTLHALTRLSNDEFGRGIAEGIIHPDMVAKDIELIRPRPERVIQNEYTQSSDGSGSPVETIRDPAASSVQQGLATPVTDNVRHDGNVAKPEATSGESCPHVPPGPSEATPMPGGGLSIAHNRVEPSDSLDFFPTPPWATRALFEHVLKHLDRFNACKFQTARDPCCGRGHMSEVMREYFSRVIASDIADYAYPDCERADFTQKTALDEEAVDWIVMNSPFGPVAEQFWKKSMELAGFGVAMLVRTQWLETPGRYQRIYKDNPPSLVAFFSERVPIHKGRWVFNGKTMTAYVWLVWIKGMLPQPPLWIEPGCRAALTKPDDAQRFGAIWEDDDGNQYPSLAALLAATRNEAPASEAAE